MNRSAKIEKSMMVKDKSQKDFFSPTTARHQTGKTPFRKVFFSN